MPEDTNIVFDNLDDMANAALLKVKGDLLERIKTLRTELRTWHADKNQADPRIKKEYTEKELVIKYLFGCYRSDLKPHISYITNEINKDPENLRSICVQKYADYYNQECYYQTTDADGTTKKVEKPKDEVLWKLLIPSNPKIALEIRTAYLARNKSIKAEDKLHQPDNTTYDIPNFKAFKKGVKKEVFEKLIKDLVEQNTKCVGNTILIEECIKTLKSTKGKDAPDPSYNPILQFITSGCHPRLKSDIDERARNYYNTGSPYEIPEVLNTFLNDTIHENNSEKRIRTLQNSDRAGMAAKILVSFLEDNAKIYQENALSSDKKPLKKLVDKLKDRTSRVAGGAAASPLLTGCASKNINAIVASILKEEKDNSGKNIIGRYEIVDSKISFQINETYEKDVIPAFDKGMISDQTKSDIEAFKQEKIKYVVLSCGLSSKHIPEIETHLMGQELYEKTTTPINNLINLKKPITQNKDDVLKAIPSEEFIKLLTENQKTAFLTKRTREEWIRTLNDSEKGELLRKQNESLRKQYNGQLITQVDKYIERINRLYKNLEGDIEKRPPLPGISSTFEQKIAFILKERELFFDKEIARLDKAIIKQQKFLHSAKKTSKADNEKLFKLHQEKASFLYKSLEQNKDWIKHNGLLSPNVALKAAKMLCAGMDKQVKGGADAGIPQELNYKNKLPNTLAHIKNIQKAKEHLIDQLNIQSKLFESIGNFAPLFEIATAKDMNDENKFMYPVQYKQDTMRNPHEARSNLKNKAEEQFETLYEEIDRLDTIKKKRLSELFKAIDIDENIERKMPSFFDSFDGRDSVVKKLVNQGIIQISEQTNHKNAVKLRILIDSLNFDDIRKNISKKKLKQERIKDIDKTNIKEKKTEYRAKKIQKEYDTLGLRFDHNNLNSIFLTDSMNDLNSNIQDILKGSESKDLFKQESLFTNIAILIENGLDKQQIVDFILSSHPGFNAQDPLKEAYIDHNILNTIVLMEKHEKESGTWTIHKNSDEFSSIRNKLIDNIKSEFKTPAGLDILIRQKYPYFTINNLKEIKEIREKIQIPAGKTAEEVLAIPANQKILSESSIKNIEPLLNIFGSASKIAVGVFNNKEGKKCNESDVTEISTFLQNEYDNMKKIQRDAVEKTKGKVVEYFNHTIQLSEERLQNPTNAILQGIMNYFNSKADSDLQGKRLNAQNTKLSYDGVEDDGKHRYRIVYDSLARGVSFSSGIGVR